MCRFRLFVYGVRKTMRKIQLIVAVAGVTLIALGLQYVGAANGDNLRQIIADRTGTACVSYNAAGDHGSVGVGIAFDGIKLLISCYSDNSITEINPADGSQIVVHTISGASSLGAMAWDAVNNQLWACSGFGTVGIVDLALNTFTPAFDTYAVAFPGGGTGSGCFDGLAYDGTDNSIWASGDVSDSVEHYTAPGVPISKTSGMYGLLGGYGNSGIAVGGAKLYLANNGGQQIYEALKDFSSVTLFAGFPRRLEDLECDPVTFTTQGVGAIWSIDAYDNILNAWEIPLGQCGLGGQPSEICGNGKDDDGDGLIDEDCPPSVEEICGDGIDNDNDGLIDEDCPPPHEEICGNGIDDDGDGLIDDDCPILKGRMTGGGSISNTVVRHGFELHCDVTDKPNRLEVNWGKGAKFHLETLIAAACIDDPTIAPNPPVAGFDTYHGKGIGRYNGVSGYTAKWTFTDAGEPGVNDYATITILDPANNSVLTVSGLLLNGNHQAHVN